LDLILPKPQSELAQEILRNPYNVGYLGLADEVSERELENAILSHVKNFLLELGTGFSFMDNSFISQATCRNLCIPSRLSW
jgi:predicted nuclease of restriction endonuclease-like (RecB) superfamily